MKIGVLGGVPGALLGEMAQGLPWGLQGDCPWLEDFTKDPWPLYYKTPPCAFYHKNVRSKAVFGP